MQAQENLGQPHQRRPPLLQISITKPLLRKFPGQCMFATFLESMPVDIALTSSCNYEVVGNVRHGIVRNAAFGVPLVRKGIGNIPYVGSVMREVIF